MRILHRSKVGGGGASADLKFRDPHISAVYNVLFDLYVMVRGASRRSSVFTYLLHDVFVINVTNDVINYDYVIRIHS